VAQQEALMLNQVDLSSPRLVLRSYRPSDAEVIWEAVEETRPSLVRWVPDIGRQQTPSAVHAALVGLACQQQRGDRVVFGVWERSSDQFLGEVGVYDVDRGSGIGEVGYWIRQTAQGHGYATEALRAVLKYVTDELGLRACEAHVASDNHRSRRVAERLGFDLTGHRAPAPRWDGEVGDVLIYTRAVAPGACRFDPQTAA